MAPSFLSKLVRATSPGHSRDGSGEHFPRPSTSAKSRSRAPSIAKPPPLPPRPSTANPRSTPKQDQENRIPTFITTNVDGVDDPGHDSDTSSSFPSVTIIPPSPHISDNKSLSASSSHTSLKSSGDHRDTVSGDANHTGPRNRTISNSSSRGRTISRPPSKTSIKADEDDLPTPTIATSGPQTPKAPKPSEPSTLTESAERQSGTKTSHEKPEPAMSSLFPGNGVRKQSSKRSLKQPPPPITISHGRSATAPAPAGQTPLCNSPDSIAGSPTGTSPPEYPSPLPTPAASANSVHLSAKFPRDPDSISLASATSRNKGKKRSWRPSTTKKPTGLASAIAASSLSLANHSLTAGQQAHLSAAANTTPTGNSPPSNSKQSVPGSPPYSAAANVSSRHVKSKSTEGSPMGSKKAIHSAVSLPRSRTATSLYSDNNSEPFGDDRPGYYSGLEESTSDDSGESDSGDDLMDLDLGEDIPVTGFAVASNRRNADFHELFSNVPEGDYLIEGESLLHLVGNARLTAVDRQITGVHYRERSSSKAESTYLRTMYASTPTFSDGSQMYVYLPSITKLNLTCLELSIPINEITNLEKKMTAFVIPNAIQITTRRAKYTFASFLSRDTTFDVIYNIWKLERHEAANIPSVAGPYGPRAVDQVAQNDDSTPRGLPVRMATQCACAKTGEHYSETALEAVVPGTPERIHNLIFASGFMKDFMAVNQKLLGEFAQLAIPCRTAPLT